MTAMRSCKVPSGSENAVGIVDDPFDGPDDRVDYRVMAHVDAVIETPGGDDPHGGEPGREGEPMTEKDVVCGMQVDSSKAAAESQYKGRTYHFCSESCKVKFEENPSRYAKTA
jgi:YHS domain-containing protein